MSDVIVQHSPAAPSAAATPEPWVLVSGGFHDRSGQDKAVVRLTEHLLNTGHPLHLVGHDFEPWLRDHPQVTTHRVPRPANVHAFGNVLLARRGKQVARRVCRANPRARVLVNGGNCPWADINWVHYLHAAWRPDLSAAPWWMRVKEACLIAEYRKQEINAIRAARVVITNSFRTRDDVLRLIPGVDARRVSPVYLGADPHWSPPDETARLRARAEFGGQPNKPLVVFVGALGYDNRKGFDTLLAAWRQLCLRQNWDGDLLIAGGGKAASSVQAAIKADGLAQRVRLLGFTDRVFELLAAADLLVSPVRYEPYGLNVQEAICRGVPAIVSTSAGVAEHYSGPLAEMLLPDPNDAADLARRIENWRADQASWRTRFVELSEQLRARTWQRMAEEFVAVASAAPRAFA